MSISKLGSPAGTDLTVQTNWRKIGKNRFFVLRTRLLHSVPLGQNVLRQHLGRDAAAERSHQGLDERVGEGLCRTKGGRRVSVSDCLMFGDKAGVILTIDQQRLTHLEVMVRPRLLPVLA